MTKDQRKKIMNWLFDYDETFEIKVEDNSIRHDDQHWFITEDKLPINKSDGNCASINERLIDPLLFDWLVEALPDRDEIPEGEDTDDEDQYFTGSYFGEDEEGKPPPEPKPEKKLKGTVNGVDINEIFPADKKLNKEQKLYLVRFLAYLDNQEGKLNLSAIDNIKDLTLCYLVYRRVDEYKARNIPLDHYTYKNELYYTNDGHDPEKLVNRKYPEFQQKRKESPDADVGYWRMIHSIWGSNSHTILNEVHYDWRHQHTWEYNVRQHLMKQYYLNQGNNDK